MLKYRYNVFFNLSNAMFYKSKGMKFSYESFLTAAARNMVSHYLFVKNGAV